MTADFDHERIDEAFRLAKSGETERALDLLRPLVRTRQGRGYVLMVMAFCYERMGQYAVARYLYSESLEAEPDIETTAKRLKSCEAICEARGLAEDFTDRGHMQCPDCGLWYRREQVSCPYCIAPEPPALPAYAASAEQGTQRESDTPFDEVRRVGQEIAGSIQEFVESERVKRATQRAEEFGRRAVSKAREVADSEKGRIARDHARELTRDERVQETVDGVEDFFHNVGIKIQDAVESQPVRNTVDAIERFFRRIFGEEKPPSRKNTPDSPPDLPERGEKQS